MTTGDLARRSGTWRGTVRARIGASLPYLAAATVLLLVYGRTLLPSIGNSGDTTKFGYLGWIAGVGHEPGYPLYTMLNAAWVHLVPVGEVAWRANLLSAVFATATCLVLLRAYLELGAGRVVATAGAVATGLIPNFWRQAVVAEVYTLHTLFVAGVLTCLVLYERRGDRRWLVGGLAVYAFSFAHHTQSVLLLVGLAVYVIWHRASFLFRPRVLATLAGACGLTLATYGYLFWRSTDPDTAYVEVPVTDLSSFVYMVSGGHFDNQLFAVGLDAILQERLPRLATLLVEQWHVTLLLPLVVLGLAVLARRFPPLAAVTVLWAVAQAVFALTYRIPDWDSGFLVTVWLLCGFWLVIGMAAVLTRVARVTIPKVVVTAGLLPALFLVAYYPEADRSEDSNLERWQSAIRATPNNSIVFVQNYREWQNLHYVYFIEGVHQSRNLWGSRGGKFGGPGPVEPAAHIDAYCSSRNGWNPPRFEGGVADVYPSGLRTYVFGDDYAAELSEHGYDPRRVQDGTELYRFRCQSS